MFIIVGGASRSGTSTISTFLHLHDDITMLRTMDQLKGTSMESMSKQCWTAIRAKRDLFQLVLFRNRQSQRDVWTTYVREKNKGLLNGDSTEHVGVRWDYAEWSNGNLVSATKKGQAKLVFSMRNLKDLFTSLSFNGFLPGNSVADRMRHFQSKTTRSIDSVRKMGNKICPVDSSNSEDLRRLIAWLGLEMNDLQKLWADGHPITNDTRKPEYEGYKGKIADEIKIPVEMERNYWALLDDVRTAYQKQKGETHV